MAFNTFTWLADLGAQKKQKPAVHPIKFGDGYEARVPIGVNFNPMIWSVKFTRATAEASMIDNFLRNQAGSLAFNWLDPENNTNVYVCREWSKSQQQFGVFVIDATFEQVFEY